MKALISISTPNISNIDNGNPIIYNRKEEWDDSFYSCKSHQKREKDTKSCIYEVAMHEPSQYPCIAIQGPLIRNSNGADMYTFIFIYNFETFGVLLNPGDENE